MMLQHNECVLEELYNEKNEMKEVNMSLIGLLNFNTGLLLSENESIQREGREAELV